LRFHPDPYRLQVISCSADTTTRIFDLNDQDGAPNCFRNHVSQPTDFGITSDGYLLVTVGRDKVLNFYELRHMAHVKTVPVMDELSSVVVLNETDSKRILKIFTSSEIYEGTENLKSTKKGSKVKEVDSNVNVLVTAGAKGLLRIFRVEMKVYFIYLL